MLLSVLLYVYSHEPHWKKLSPPQVIMWTKVTIPTSCVYVADENNYSHTMWWMKVTIPTTCAYVVDESHYSHTMWWMKVTIPTARTWWMKVTIPTPHFIT